ncbi:MAG: hypothetical protein JWO91_205 [Acidobacteriaceae bacterium]|nr:hypothetical protein [Acidobacteriaceae bacterium]
MARLRKLYIGDKLLNTPQPFEEELDSLVITNHNLLMENLSRIRREWLASSDGEDSAEILDYANECRRAANNFALVALVTRLHHWIAIFVGELTKTNHRDKGLIANLNTLEKQTGEGRIPISFFEGLTTVRDSVIHGDSQVEWFYKRNRRVADKYANTDSGEVEFTEEHLQEAIKNSVEQVKWYEAQLDVLGVFS